MDKLDQSDGFVLEKENKNNSEISHKMTYEEVCNEIKIAEKMITDFSEEIKIKIVNLKKERDLLWKDWQTEEQVKLKKYIGKLCLVSDTGNNDDWRVGILDSVIKSTSKETPFNFEVNGNWHDYYFIKVMTTESVKEFIYKE